MDYDLEPILLILNNYLNTKSILKITPFWGIFKLANSRKRAY